MRKMDVLATMALILRGWWQMQSEQLLLEKEFLLKKELDKNLQKKHLVENIIRKKKEELKETEVLLEKMQTTVFFRRS
jgi:hypothetical protein